MNTEAKRLPQVNNNSATSAKTDSTLESPAAVDTHPQKSGSGGSGGTDKLGSLPLIAWIVIGAVGLGLITVLVLVRMRPPEFHGVLIQSPDEAADFTLMSSTGEPMSLSDFRGKHVLLYFGYTFCPDVCPTTLNDLKAMMAELGPKKAEDVQVIMISVDPERDTVEQLATYLPYFHPSFIGMTGELEELETIASQYGVFFEQQKGDTAAGYLVDHTAVVTLVDDEGHVRMIFPYGTTGEDMAADLDYMIR